MLRKYFVVLILLAACSQNVDTTTQEITNNDGGQNVDDLDLETDKLSTTIQDNLKQAADRALKSLDRLIIEDPLAASGSTTPTTIPVTSSTTIPTTTSIPITTETPTPTDPIENIITMHTPSERIGTLYEKFGYKDFIDRFPGYEGDEKANLLIQIAVNQLPDTFRTMIKEEIIVLNGCHPYGQKLFDKCVYGVFDPVGYDGEGNYGNDWSQSIWISDRGLTSGYLNDILLHESAHAYSFLTLRTCKLPGGESYRNLAHEKFGGEENLADIFVYYFGGKWTNYIDLEILSISDRKWISEMISYCDLYKLEKNL